MAYGLKYILRYETERFGTDVRVLIYQKDYAGPSTPKRIGANRIHLTRDKDGQICGTTLDFSIQADIDKEYADFFSLDNRAHKVELEFFGTVTWTGYIVSSQYSEPFIAPPYDVQVMCTDALGLLKNEDFQLTGMRSRFEAIRYCIDKTGIALRYAININVWEENMDQAGHNMLDQLYFDAGTLAGKTCYEALQALLPENVFINQANSFWMIERPTDRTLNRYIFNADGTPSEETYDWHTYLRKLSSPAYKAIDHGCLYPIGNLTQDMQSAWRKFTIKQIFGKKESYFKNYNFQAGTEYWTPTVTALPFLTSKKTDKTSYLILSGFQTSLTNKAEQTVSLVRNSPVTLAINYAWVAFYRNTDGTNSKLKTSIVFQVKLVGATATHYLDQKGWGTTAKNITIKDVESSTSFNTINFQTLKIEASRLPESGLLTVSMYQINDSQLGASDRYHVNGLCIENVLFYDNDIAGFNDSEETTVILNENATESEKTIELMPCDIPDFENAEHYFANGNYTKDAEGNYIPCRRWGSHKVRYIEYMAAYMSYLHKQPSEKLIGEISGWLELNSYIQHVLTGKVYMIDKGTWHIIEHTFTLDLIELPADEFTYDNYAKPVAASFDPVWNLLGDEVTADTTQAFYRRSGDTLRNKYGASAEVTDTHITFPEMDIDVFNRQNIQYWGAGLSVIDANPRKWPVGELTSDTIDTYGTALTKSRLFLNDYDTDPEEIMPIMLYNSDRASIAETRAAIIRNKINTGRHVKTIDGSFEVPIPGTTTPIIVARKQTIDPYKLDFDSGTPQFSLKAAEVETNVNGEANAIKIAAGEIISHHYAALDRTSIRFIKEAEENYDPTRSWDIAETDITLPDDDEYFLYVKVPLAEA